ncbi:unnamed protein product [Pleuronectes platessa]|uniref:Uncharacterized protein n=1 Tax=Pleuronectes platessa TaxID=8262 RepID=A0A9N7U5R1_PLEPL|nr:unnamed protein product [Pleuronectes platessa]
MTSSHHEGRSGGEDQAPVILRQYIFEQGREWPNLGPQCVAWDCVDVHLSFFLVFFWDSDGTWDLDVDAPVLQAKVKKGTETQFSPFLCFTDILPYFKKNQSCLVEAGVR